MFLSDFDFALPDELIARYPTDNRRDSRLLCVGTGSGDTVVDRLFADLPSLLQPNDLLIFNDTRVIPARLFGSKASGGRVEVLVERVTADTKAQALIRASKAPRPGTVIEFPDGCTATVTSRARDLYSLTFSTRLADYLEKHGSMPLPPYLGREAESADDERYQTVYADVPGAVAAPTAGLHFDTEMLAELAAKGVNREMLTLHVGAGTFQSLREKNVEDNVLHAERIVVDESVCRAVNGARRNGGRVIAVGTTVVRALEAAANNGRLAPCAGETDVFIFPGYNFQIADAILTNFHLPQSSLLMLVAAFAGIERTLSAYRHAVRERYRFFSYGDAMLVFPKVS